MGDWTGLIAPTVFAPFVSAQTRLGLTNAGATGELRVTGPLAAGSLLFGVIAPTAAFADTMDHKAKGSVGFELVTPLPLLPLYPALAKTGVFPFVTGSIELDTTGHLRASAGVEALLGIDAAGQKNSFSLGAGWQHETIGHEAVNGAYLSARVTFF